MPAGCVGNDPRVVPNQAQQLATARFHLHQRSFCIFMQPLCNKKGFCSGVIIKYLQIGNEGNGHMKSLDEREPGQVRAGTKFHVVLIPEPLSERP